MVHSKREAVTERFHVIFHKQRDMLELDLKSLAKAKFSDFKSNEVSSRLILSRFFRHVMQPTVANSWQQWDDGPIQPGDLRRMDGKSTILAAWCPSLHRKNIDLIYLKVDDSYKPRRRWQRMMLREIPSPTDRKGFAKQPKQIILVEREKSKKGKRVGAISEIPVSVITPSTLLWLTRSRLDATTFFHCRHYYLCSLFHATNGYFCKIEFDSQTAVYFSVLTATSTAENFPYWIMQFSKQKHRNL